MAASRHSGRIFGVGLARTGTTSLAKALQQLGYKTAHAVPEQLIDGFDAVVDAPIPSLYKFLDLRYPGSKFILTVRSPGAWLASFRRLREQPAGIDPAHLAKILGPDHALTQLSVQAQRNAMQVYDTIGCEPEKVLPAYFRHQAAVVQYFSGRLEDLLILDVCAGAGGAALCPFLGIAEIPEGPLPHLNQGPLSPMQKSLLFMQQGLWASELIEGIQRLAQSRARS